MVPDFVGMELIQFRGSSAGGRGMQIRKFLLDFGKYFSSEGSETKASQDERKVCFCLPLF